MTDRPVALTSVHFNTTRLPESALKCYPRHEFPKSPECDTFDIIAGGGNGCDTVMHVICSVAQLEHLQASIDALLQDRSRALGPPAVIEGVYNDDEGF